MSKTIAGREVAPKVGSWIAPDGWTGWGKIEACDWSAADWRIRSWKSGRAPAVNVEITGRTLQRRRGHTVVRCRIEWVRDGRPNKTTGGWLVL